MGFFSGCMDARNMTSIEEVKCPKCSADIEVFVRDGKTVGESVMGIYSSLSPVSADMVRSWTQGVTVTLSPSLCLISIFTVGIVFTILSIIVLRKRSY